MKRVGVFGLSFRKLNLDEVDIINLILIKDKFVVKWYICRYFYLKTDFKYLQLSSV